MIYKVMEHLFIWLEFKRARKERGVSEPGTTTHMGAINLIGIVIASMSVTLPRTGCGLKLEEASATGEKLVGFPFHTYSCLTKGDPEQSRPLKGSK